MIHLGYTLGGEPVSPLPAEFLAEHGTPVFQALVAGRRAQRSARLTLFVRVMNDKYLFVGLLVFLD